MCFFSDNVSPHDGRWSVKNTVATPLLLGRLQTRPALRFTNDTWVRRLGCFRL